MRGSNNFSKYESLIISFVHAAISQTEGAVDPANSTVNNSGFNYRHVNNVHIFFNEDKVTIDACINVLYGYNIPQVACEIQEKVLKSINNTIKINVNSININVENVIFI